jgi:hypothetical protein
MTTPSDALDAKILKLIDTVPDDVTNPSTTDAVKALETLSKVHTALKPEPEIIPDPVYIPVTRLEKFRAGLSKAWDNETTRAVIKAGGAFAGVAYVTHATIKKDHILERQALAQANANQPR